MLAQSLGLLGKKSIAAVLASSAVLIVVGCSNMETTATNASLSSQGASVTGKVHGGNQPVGYATVQIYTVGQTGLGSSGTLLATTTTTPNGSFSFSKQPSGTYANTGNTYTCPSGTDPLLYIISRGGNTTGTGGSAINNSAAVFLAPLGLCSKVTNSQFVDISEVTTAAMVAATEQFINPSTEQIGNDGIGVAYNAILNAFNTVPLLVNLSNGLANTTVSLSGASATGGYNVSAVTVTATIPAARLNTIANILSACINQPSASGTNCSTLFSSATPPSNVTRTSQPSGTLPAATDTLQAALYMFLNPTDGSTANRTALYNLSPATGAPYQPTITSLPTDWTLGISYASSSTCGTGSTFFSHPYDVQVDSNGNLWIANSGGTNSALVEITNNGVPTTCATLGGNGKADVVDINGNVWFADNANSLVYRFRPSDQQLRTYSTAAPPLDIATDGTGSVYFTTLSGSTGSVFKILNGANTDGVNTPTLISNTVGPNPAHIFPDNATDLWVSSGGAYVSQLNPATGGNNFVGGYTTTNWFSQNPSYGIIVGPTNKVYSTAGDPQDNLTILSPQGSGYVTTFTSGANAGGMSNPAGLWLDGAQNSWIANNSPETSTGLYGLAVIAQDGTSLSSDGKANGGYQKASTLFNAVRAVLIDQVGNVWVTNDNNPNSITEVVGAAVPMYGPYSTGLQNGRFQTIP